jgi:hypothetical protein
LLVKAAVVILETLVILELLVILATQETTEQVVLAALLARLATQVV